METTKRILAKAKRSSEQPLDGQLRDILDPLVDTVTFAITVDPENHRLIAVSTPLFNGLSVEKRSVVIDRAIELLERMKLPPDQR